MSILNKNISTIKETIQELFPRSEWGNNGSVKLYTSFEDEYRSLKKGVAVRNISHNTQLKLTGKETLDFLHRISTNSLKDLELYTQKNTLFTTEKGRLIDRTTLFRFGEFNLLLGSPDTDEKLKSWLEKYIIMEDIKVENIAGYFTILELLGLQSKSFMTVLCGNKIEQLDGYRIIVGETDKIKTYITKSYDISGIEKYWVITQSENTGELINYIKDNKSVFDLNFVGDNVYDVFRVENGLPVYPNEINDDYNPHEINLIHEVDFKKGCYIGQEVIARLDTYEKVQRKMIGTVADKDIQIELPASIYSDDENEVGQLTSFVNPSQSRPSMGVALVKKKFLEENKEYFIKSAGNEIIKITFTDFPIK